INGVADVVNADPRVAERLKVVFFPDFNVKNARLIYPAADLSEQISTAGKEASGTGNMKFMFNGALTIGTLDGANVEIREEAGADNFFLFGLKADEVEQIKREGYRPQAYVERNTELRIVLQLIANGHFSRGDPEVFRPLVDNLMQSDPFLVLADFEGYDACQDTIDAVWRDPDRWSRMSILNTARAGKFSSDRAIREYCSGIWTVRPVGIAVPSASERGALNRTVAGVSSATPQARQSD
ncbi:MAG TPA: glycogen/starch/alpha-glucan phosphorylase, partial [Burkholderiales bacterium]